MKNFFTVSTVALAVSLSACINDPGEQKAHPPGVSPVSVNVGSSPESQNKGEVRKIRLNEPENSVQLPESDVSRLQANAEIAQVMATRQKAHTSYLIASQPTAQESMVLDNFGSSQLQYYPAVNTEKYIHFIENGIKLVQNDPVSTFSIDVDTASYSNVRRMLEGEGRVPPKDAVKVEEMINYFSYDYPVPESMKTPFSVTTEIAQSPWNPNRHLLQIGLKGYESEPVDRPAANLVFLIDVSGSMTSEDKLPLVKRSLRLLVNQMNQKDRIALVVYAGAAGLVLDSTSVSERGKIMRAIDALQAGGSTNGEAGLNLAYSVAAANQVKNGINRVIIASDGDMNVGIADHEALKNLIEQKREFGIALTTLGFGTGNYNYALMEQLADVGNGNAAYIDSIKEAQKVLVNEMQSTLLTIAKDVKIQIEFNPGVVAEYRLIGYENRILNREDFRNDKVDAGDIGSGHTVTAFYEIALVSSEDTLIPELRYGNSKLSGHVNKRTNTALENEIGFVRLRFKHPDATTSEEISQPILTSSILDSIGQASANMRFAASVAGFGQLLRGGKFIGEWGLNDVVGLARSARGSDHHGYRGEFIRLVELTDSLGLTASSGVNLGS